MTHSSRVDLSMNRSAPAHLWDCNVSHAMELHGALRRAAAVVEVHRCTSRDWAPGIEDSRLEHVHERDALAQVLLVHIEDRHTDFAAQEAVRK